MGSFWQFANAHPVEGVAIAAVACVACVAALNAPLVVVNRIVRHLNIRTRGWPPAHLDLDADGDQVSG